MSVERWCRPLLLRFTFPWVFQAVIFITYNHLYRLQYEYHILNRIKIVLRLYYPVVDHFWRKKEFLIEKNVLECTIGRKTFSDYRKMCGIVVSPKIHISYPTLCFSFNEAYLTLNLSYLFEVIFFIWLNYSIYTCFNISPLESEHN